MPIFPINMAPSFTMDAPTCFVSYSWDSNSHKKWVLEFSTSLQSSGVHTHLDQWDIKLGMDIPRYMETCVRESQFVLLICTPNFAKKANSGEGGVGYEKSIVTGEIFQGVAKDTKFVPVLRLGSPNKALPSYLQTRTFVDMRADEKFTTGLEEVLRHIFDAPIIQRPGLGTRPVRALHGVTHGAHATLPHPCGLNTRSCDGGNFASFSAGLIGRGAKLPPQFGQRPLSLCSTQSRQNVHSKVQIIASTACGGRSLSQHSQLGRSSSMIASVSNLSLLKPNPARRRAPPPFVEAPHQF
jgi:hypothetical protein